MAVTAVREAMADSGAATATATRRAATAGSGTDRLAASGSAALARMRPTVRRDMKKIPISARREIISGTGIIGKRGQRWTPSRFLRGRRGGTITVRSPIPDSATMSRRWSMRDRRRRWSRIMSATAVWYSASRAAAAGMSKGRHPTDIPTRAAAVSV